MARIQDSSGEGRVLTPRRGPARGLVSMGRKQTSVSRMSAAWVKRLSSGRSRVCPVAPVGRRCFLHTSEFPGRAAGQGLVLLSLRLCWRKCTREARLVEAGDRGPSNAVLAASQLVAFVCGEKEPSHGLLVRLQAVGGALVLGEGSGCLGPRVLRLLAHRLPCRGGLESGRPVPRGRSWVCAECRLLCAACAVSCHGRERQVPCAPCAPGTVAWAGRSRCVSDFV